MLRRVSMEGVPLPRLYIAENKRDVEEAVAAGIPFVKWTRGNDELVKYLLRPVLEKMFPHIKWDKVLGSKPKGRSLIVNDPVDPAVESMAEGSIDEDFDNDAAIEMQEEVEEMPADPESEWAEVADPAEGGYRMFDNGGPKRPVAWNKTSVWDYMQDEVSSVNIEALQSLGLLPKFMGDIADCVKVNLSNRMRWTEGYNKKLGIPVGRFDASPELPNLIILDVSGSIPRGIAATMLTMIDTLRSQVSADLIITSSNSVYYPMGCELPSPDKLRRWFGYGNECREFYAILNRYVAGRKWGHVISFGDYDAPATFKYHSDNVGDDDLFLAGTSVKAVHHYHTGCGVRHYDEEASRKTGYALWVHDLGCSPEEHYDTSWCSVIGTD